MRIYYRKKVNLMYKYSNLETKVISNSVYSLMSWIINWVSWSSEKELAPSKLQNY